MVRNQRGSFLVEMMVAVTVLGIFMSMFASMQVAYYRKFNEVSNDTNDQASFRAIEADILRDERYIFPESTNSTLAGATLNDQALADSFGAAKHLHTRCYDKDGVPRGDKTCFYNVTFYRVSVADRRIAEANSIYSKIPVSRLNIRVQWGKLNLTSRQVETQTAYITRLLTSVFPY